MLTFNTGDTVFYQGVENAVFKVKDFDRIFIRNKKTNFVQQVLRTELSDRSPEAEETQDPYEKPIEAYSEKQLTKARRRLAIISPFLGDLKGDKKMLIRTAEANNLNVSTLYNWIAKFETYGHIGCLVDSEMKGGKDRGRFEENVELKMSEIIDEVYLDAKSFENTYREIVNQFKELGYKVPHSNTVRRRIKRIAEYVRISRRKGPRAAAQEFDPKTGSIPHAKTPLALVQIDHTELDIILVDEKERKPFKRPWITVLIDVYSRMILGFYISFDPPSAYSVGRAITHSILPKEEFLKSIGLPELKWPCWGKMATLMCDNAKEFRGVMLKENCADYKITLKWRPPHKPEFGGHIERLMGSIAELLKDLGGSTKVGKEMRASLKPEKTAAMTLSEFERYFTTWVVDVYHKRAHRGINKAMPIDKWAQGIWGSNSQPGVGMQDIITDEDKLKLDFLPQVKRTIPRMGVQIFNFTYFSGVLQKWIGAKDETSPAKVKAKRKFVFKIDPRDISSILFLNPADNKYHEIPSTLNIKPDILSTWDLRRASEELKKNNKPVDQEAIYASYKQLKQMEEESQRLTKDAKRKNERESRMKKEEKIGGVQPSQTVPLIPKVTPIKNLFNTSNKKIEPYEELEFTNGKRSFK